MYQTDTSSLGRTWHIPHHGVLYHLIRPGKIYVAFACGAEFEGRFINPELLSGSNFNMLSAGTSSIHG